LAGRNDDLYRRRRGLHRVCRMREPGKLTAWSRIRR
jgi:hypothetical protein